MNKAYFASLFRHALSGLSGLGGMLASRNLIDPADVAAVNSKGTELADLIAFLVAAMIGRLVISLFGKFLPSPRSENRSGGAPGGDALLLLVACMTAASFGLLSSCTNADFPVTGSVFYRDPKTGAKAGLAFVPGERPNAYVRVPVYDPETGEKRGEANLSAPIAKRAIPAVDAQSGK
jgi:hypothetical protein